MTEKIKTRPLKWPTSQARKEAFARLIEHVESGLSIDSWEDADFETTKKYLKEFPEDFDPERFEQAKRKAKVFFEKIGIQGTIGAIDKFNANSYKFIMSNKFGWHERAVVDTTVARKLEAGDEEILNQYINNQLNQKKDKKK